MAAEQDLSVFNDSKVEFGAAAWRTELGVAEPDARSPSGIFPYQ